jgi:hypothetical protein
MKTLRTSLTGALIAFLAVTGWSGTTLSVRLVEASPKPASSSVGLEDVVGILSRNLPYASFTLQDSQTIALPANQSVSMGGFSVTCTGAQQELQLAIKRDGRALISTILRLNDGTPLIVGGFPSANGKQIFVLVAR